MERKEKLLILLRENKSLEFVLDDSSIVLTMEDNKIRLIKKVFILENNKIVLQVLKDIFISDNAIEEFCNDTFLFKQVDKMYQEKCLRDLEKLKEYKKMISTINDMNIKESDLFAVKDVIELCFNNGFYNFNEKLAITIEDPLSCKIGFKILYLKIDSYKEFDNDYEKIVEEIINLKHKNNNEFLNKIEEAKIILSDDIISLK